MLWLVAMRIISVFRELPDLLKSVQALTGASKHDWSNLPHLTATVVHDAKAFVLCLEPTQGALGSVCSDMDYAPHCLVRYCESFVDVIMVSLQNVKKKKKNHTKKLTT